MLFMLAYHGRLGSKGAFLALSQFFTVSGFLITAIILDGHARRGSIDVRNFWVRRVRRLAPGALLGVAVAVLFGATIATRTQADRLPGEVLGAVTYVVNWVFIATDQSYVDLFASPSPLQHFWSLAIEEQFYLLLPLILIGLLRLGAGYRAITVVFAAATLAGTAWTAYLFENGATIDRLYYGTDTRIAEILVGVVLACILHQVGTGWSERTRWAWAGGGIVAFVLSVVAWHTFTIPDSLPWQGGLLVNGLLSAVLIVALIGGRGPLVAFYSLWPLAAFGRLTYSLYIFHWPIFLWLDEDRLDLERWPLFGVRMVVTMAAALLSYHFVEKPIRAGAGLGVPARWRGFLVPGVAALLVVVAFTTTRAASDPLATLRTDDASFAVPIAAEDGNLDILAVGEQADGALAELVELAEGEEHVDVHLGGTLECTGGSVPVGEGRTCGRWAEEWPALVEEHDPEVVLLYTDGWAGDDLAGLRGEAPDVTAAAGELVAGGIDLLTAGGAQVVWASPGADLLVGLTRSNDPMLVALRAVEQSRDDVFHVVGGQLPDAAAVSPADYRTDAADALLTNAALYQRADRADLTRVMIVGDSQARSLGYGLERWAAAGEDAWVWNVAVEGCGVLRDGLIPDFGGERPVLEHCRRVRDDWRTQVERFEPDLVLVLTSAYDLGPRRLEGWDEPALPGDERFDAYLLDEYRASVDVLAEGGATVVWMQPPCAELRSGQPGLETNRIDEEALRHLTDDLLPALASERPDDVVLYDLGAVICPGGEARETTDDGEPMRFDGVHFTEAASLWFADEHGAELLDLGEDR
jgi:peptidoglycan/LPS O-acetylase OafA/YrhL